MSPIYNRHVMERVDREAVRASNDFDLPNQMDSWLYECLESILERLLDMLYR